MERNYIVPEFHIIEYGENKTFTNISCALGRHTPGSTVSTPSVLLMAETSSPADC